MGINRRGALALLGLGGGIAAAAAASAMDAVEDTAVFAHGVASGDPLADRVIIWTRVSGFTGSTRVFWAVYADEAMTKTAAEGSFDTDAGRDFTVKVDVKGLKPNTDYWYDFKVPRGMGDAAGSPRGHFRTLPTGKVNDVVLAVATCALWGGGWFNAYRAIADMKRVDAVLHLGDYIYEYDSDHYGKETADKLGRIVQPPRELVTLEDYRLRLAHYRTDPDLQAAHARAPWIVVWDDHETANDSWEHGAQNHQPETEGDWDARKAAAIKAYYEWMPLREPKDSLFASYRSFHFGDLAAIIMTETRLTARSKQLTYTADLPVKDGKPDAEAFRAKWNDPARRMMSPAQEAWIGRELAASVKAGHAWQVLGNQVVMARVVAPDLKATVGQQAWEAAMAAVPAYERPRIERLSMLSAAGLPYNLDSWDGYPADRQRLAEAFKGAGANPIVLSGDSHASWANEIFDADGRTRVAAEFGVTAVTSPGAPESFRRLKINEAFAEKNAEVVFCDQFTRGFLVLTLTRESATGALMGVSTVMDKTFDTAPIKTFAVKPVKGGGVGPLKEV